MKINKLLLLVIPVLLLSSCSDEIETGQSGLLGSWTNEQVNDSLLTFQRTASLSDNKYGFSFDSSGKFVERTISGWCATPPVSYVNNQGSWTSYNDMVFISTTFWGGTATYKWKILSVDKFSLKLCKISEKYTEK